MQCLTVAPDGALRVTYPGTDASSRLRNVLIDRSISTDHPGAKVDSWLSELISLEDRTIGSALSWGHPLR